MKIAAYLVSIGPLLCLALLYGWRFVHKISLDWPLSLTTQLLLQNFLTTLHKSRSKSLMKSSLEWATIKLLHTLGFFFCFLQQCPKKQSCHSELQKKKIFSFLTRLSWCRCLSALVCTLVQADTFIASVACLRCSLSCDLNFICILRASSLWHRHFAG